MDEEKSLQRLIDLERAFSPSAPIASKELFLGRYQQIEKTCDAINERGQHFVVYGERGVGKTSLANIINSKLTNVCVAKVTCNRGEDFKQIWEK
jgi:replication-associated recombination protein RarA